MKANAYSISVDIGIQGPVASAYHDGDESDEESHKTLHEVIKKELLVHNHDEDDRYYNGITCDVCEVVYKR